MPKLSVVAWRWGGKYSADHVNRMRAMVRRHLKFDHEFFCITDDPTGLDEFVTVVPLEPFGPVQPKCLHRLNIFGPASDAIGGDWILQLDIDAVVTGSLAPLLRFDDDMTIWRCPSLGRRGYALNPSFMLFRRAALRPFWDEIADDLRAVQQEAKAARWTGSDQAVISARFDGRCRTLDERDGLYSFRDHIADGRPLPEDARLVGFYDAFDPADPTLTPAHPWIYRHWRGLRMDLLDVLAKRHGWTRGAELGVFRGDTFLHLLQRNPGLTMIGVDTWTPADVPDRGEDGARSYRKAPLSKFETRLRRACERYGDRAVLIKDRTDLAAAQVEDASLDFVFVDADHTEPAVRADILAWAPKIRPGGWLLGHDYFDRFPGVIAAVDDLLPGRRLHPDFCWSIPVGEIRWLRAG
jgi:hypothetical protein